MKTLPFHAVLVYDSKRLIKPVSPLLKTRETPFCYSKQLYPPSIVCRFSNPQSPQANEMVMPGRFFSSVNLATKHVFILPMKDKHLESK